MLAGGSLREDVIPKVREDFLKTWAINNCFWPPVLALNMKFVALNNQATVGGVAHAVWNIFLAYMANRSTNDTTIITDTAGGGVGGSNDLQRALEAETRPSAVYWSGEASTETGRRPT
jgi:hypothetical protein